MKSGPIPPNDRARVAKLHAYGILDTLDEEEYDDIAELVSRICETPMANISFVDRERQWFKAVVGLEGRQTSRDIAFCGHTILGNELFVVKDAQVDDRFRDNPLVLQDPRIRFYAGMPLVTPDGYKLGALCAIDSKPRELSETQRRTLEVLSRHVVDLLEKRVRNRELEQLSELKTRLLAVVGHDLRSPIASLSSALSVLASNELSCAEQEELLGDLEQSLQSAESLIENLVDWASRNIDPGAASSEESVDLGPLIEDLRRFLELSAVTKNNRLIVDLEGAPAPKGDRSTVAFILRNLAMNANKFTEDGMIRIEALAEEGRLGLSVLDSGIGMSPEHVEALFDWSLRSKRPGTRGEQGSGLGMLLSHDMAERIGGTLAVSSAPGAGSRFTLWLPL